jgi:acetyl-CoA synthetase
LVNVNYIQRHKFFAANEISDLGDTTTLADPAVVDDIVKNRVL